MEIEKKYRIKELPENLEQYEKKEIEQGYLCTDPVVRIRKSNDSYILTYKRKEKKGELPEEDAAALVNHEVEMLLTKKAYHHLKEKVDDYVIRKTRYLIPLENDLTGELDVFHDVLEGLHFIEVEFKSEEEAKKFVPPSWFLDDVTFDERFRNNYLTSVDEETYKKLYF